ncbi:MAG: cytochrome c oxidase subunit II, partial [Pseudomonadota bacterium]
TMVEVVWTAGPILILLFIALFSFDLLYKEDVVPEADMTVKVSGYQWGWSYSYPDHGDFEFASNMLPEEDVVAMHGDTSLYRLEVDNRVVVPAGATVRVITTATDVIHSWAIPQFALKLDAVPGRLNETWFKADTPDIYYGQCSEICGIKHAFMPIAVEVVPQSEFEAWVDEQRAFAGLPPMYADQEQFADAGSDAAAQ